MRKAAQVTPPPSPKNGEEIKTQATEWSSRLRNHIKACETKRSPDSCSRRVQIKKENPGLIQEESSESRNCGVSAFLLSSLTCTITILFYIEQNSVSRQRHLSGDALNYWGPRRSARLIGIPAEVDSCCREVADSEKESKYPRAKRKSISSEGDCCCYQIPLVNGKLRSSDGITDSQDICPMDSVCNLQPVQVESTNCLPLKKRRLPPLEHLDTNGVDNSNSSDHSVDETNKIETEYPVESTPISNGHVSCGKEKGKGCKKSRTMEALLVESERFMQYPSKNACRSRSTYNSRDIRPPSASPVPFSSQEPVMNTSPARSTSFLSSVDQVEFSFEIVPTQATWYQTFMRDEHESTNPPAESGPSSSDAAPFLLPYEMSLETILKSNRAVRQQKKKQKSPKKPPQTPQFRPIISTRLQMQTAARQSQIQEKELKAAAAAVATNGPMRREENHRQSKGPWKAMPRKSPRCHASTLAILCSKQGTPTPQEDDEDLQGAVEQDDGPCTRKKKADARLVAIVEEESAESNLDRPETATCSESEQEGTSIFSAWERMLTKGVGQVPGTTNCGSPPRKRKRGRPRKRTAVEDKEAVRMARLLATPLDRIEDIVDERIVYELESGSAAAFDDDSCTLLDSVPDFLGTYDRSDGSAVNGPELEQQRNGPEVCLTKAEVLHQVLQSIALDLQSDRCSSSTNSIYETASDLGSTSTTASGTCHSRKKWRRRKRNMTGWPRSKKRKPTNNFASDVSEMSNDGTTSLSGSDAPYLSPCREILVDNPSCSEAPNLSTIDEVSSSKNSPASMTAESQTSTGGGSPSSRTSRDNQPQLSKPFQFQRKTLKFVGKRILRQKRHAPQRLEYWPRFASANESRKRRRRKS